MNDEWGMWAEEKEPVEDQPVNWVPNGERTPFTIGNVMASFPAVTTFLDSIQLFSRPSMRGKSSLGGTLAEPIVINIENTDRGLDAEFLDKFMVRFLKERKVQGMNAKFMALDEMSIFEETSSFEEVKPNWTENRGLKGKGLQPKKPKNDPKGNPVYGTNWRKK